MDWSQRDAYGIPVANYSHHQGNFPQWAEDLAVRMLEDGLVSATPNHVHITRYKLGKGIPPHIDAVHSGGMTFGAEIAALALRSSRVLEITPKRGRRRLRALLFPGDVYVILGDLRYTWEHGIPDTEVDVFRGRSYLRSDAISATWRVLSSRGDIPEP